VKKNLTIEEILYIHSNNSSDRIKKMKVIAILSFS